MTVSIGLSFFCEVSDSAQTLSVDEQTLSASSPPFQGDAAPKHVGANGERYARCIAIPRERGKMVE
jgi:hypothetical protein